MIRAIFCDRIERIGHHVVRVVNASWNGNRSRKEGDMDVYRQWDDGREEVRNIAYQYMCGYFVYDTKPERWAKPCMDLENAFNIAGISSYKTFTYLTEGEREDILSLYPGFRWFIDKVCSEKSDCRAFCADVFRYLKAWVRWPECERLYNGGFKNLCVSQQFACATYTEQRRIFEYLMAHPEVRNPGMNEVRTLIKNRMTQDEYIITKRYRIGPETLRYLHAQLQKGTCFREEYSFEALFGVYKDYLKMAKECGHDMNDRYWKYPSDLRKAHDKVMDEKANIDAAKLLKRQEMYGEAVRKFMGKTLRHGNMDVFVPHDVTDISLQATKLHQCLVTADYIGKVIDRKCLLVFIRNAGKPVATAELNRNGTTVQFYGDERSSNMKPGKDAEDALNKWIRTFKPRIRKVKEAA